MLSDTAVCHINVRSLSSEKLRCLRADIAPHHDIITLSETFLSPGNLDMDLTLPGFHTIMRKDRKTGPGGGVGLFVSQQLLTSRRYDLEEDDLELLWSEIIINNNKLLIGVVYRPPDSPVSFWNNLQNNLDQARSTGIQNIMLIGDLNADFSTPQGRKLELFCTTNFLVPHVHEPTRITNNTSSCLDQIISNMPAYVQEPQVLPPIANCDHCVVSTTILFKHKKELAYKRLIWDYGKANFDLFRSKLRQISWEDSFVSNDINQCCTAWTEIFLQIAKESIPNKEVTIRPNDLPWYTSALRQERRKMMRLYSKAKNCNNVLTRDAMWTTYNHFRNQYQEHLRLAEEDYNKKLNNSLKNSKMKNKAWWRTVKHFLNRNHRQTIPSLLHEGKHISDSATKASIFNSFFLDQMNIDTSSVQNPTNPVHPHRTMGDLHVSEQEVLDILKCLDISKASGPDGISPKLLKEAASIIHKPLTILFNMSLTQKQFPSIWKEANVTPLYKKGEENSCSNYRPISLLSCTGKVFEKVVFKHVFNFFRDNLVISPNQSGFIPGDSTVNQLVSLYHELSLAVDQQKEVRVVFLDISKAFDKVWHAGLLYKLEKNGITNNLLSWFGDYLYDRRQRVVLNGQSSTWGSITAGVPQGSVLGPLLFLIYINDIVDVVNSKVKLFADDTSLYLTVDDPEFAATTLNRDLSSLDVWSKNWIISFNALKTDSMLISLKRNSPDHPPLVFQGHQLENVPSHKHLGLVLKSDLKWNVHINHIVTKASKLLNIMKSLQYTLDRETLETIYKSFIRPIMEYGSVVWDGCAQADAKLLEDIQLTAARTVTGAMKTTPAAKLYEETGWETLEKRRERSKLTLMYKIINRLTPQFLFDILPDLPDDNPRYNLRQRPDAVSSFNCRTCLFENSFFPSTTKLWNLLPSEIRNSPTLAQFKRKISNPCIPSVKYPELLNVGNRFTSILHSRLRMGRSQLNEHLHKIGVIESPACSCGATSESVWHYFLTCPRYMVHRDVLHTTISSVAPFSLHTILFGSSECNLDQNTIIFKAVHVYIEKSERFRALTPTQPNG